MDAISAMDALLQQYMDNPGKDNLTSWELYEKLLLLKDPVSSIDDVDFMFDFALCLYPLQTILTCIELVVEGTQWFVRAAQLGPKIKVSSEGVLQQQILMFQQESLQSCKPIQCNAIFSTPRSTITF